MKLTQSHANKLYLVMSQIKSLQKKESILKNKFKKYLGDGSFSFGPYLVMITESERLSLDREAIRNALGYKIKKYERVTHYQKLEIKKMKGTRI